MQSTKTSYSFGTPISDNPTTRRIGESWATRAQVKTSALENEAGFDTNNPDFLEELLPFHQQSEYRALPQEHKSKILTAGWYVYNLRTVCIENDVVSPACMQLLRGELPGRAFTDWATARVIAETLVDESYHTLLAISVCRITARHRRFFINVPEFELLTVLNRARAAVDADHRALVAFGFATVSELFISDYLCVLDHAPGVQTLHRNWVAAHKKDEIAHNRVFAVLFEALYRTIGHREKEALLLGLRKGILGFNSSEWDVWANVMAQLNVPGGFDLIANARAKRGIPPTTSAFEVVEELMTRLGICKERVFPDASAFAQ